MNPSFDYYYGAQADQFSFIRIPKIMLTEKAFAKLSLQAKVLYAVLLDRMTLSRKNAWFDEENRVFIIYQIGEIQEDLGFSKKKAMDLLSELEKFGLLEKKRRGHGLPNILYVKSFMTGNTPAEASGEITGNAKAASRSAGSGTSGRSSPDSGSPQNSTLRGDNFSTLEVPVPAPHEVLISGPLKNYTKNNQIEVSQIKSNHIDPAEYYTPPVDPAGYDEMRFDGGLAQLAKEYRALIRDNIEYDYLLAAHPNEHELVAGIAELILETVLNTSEQIVIASSAYPTELVKSRLLKLKYSHIEYVIACLRENSTKIRNIRKYLLAALFNAPTTIDSYYTAEANYDTRNLIAAEG